MEAKAAELRARDAEYVRAVEQHGRDVDMLLAKMCGDSAAMQARYEVCGMVDAWDVFGFRF